ncbi:MAG: NAD(P)H-dependent oxidoreductase subunit E [Dysosmobacter sp.]
MELVADMLHISVSRVYSVATFYENFSLEPKGKHIIKVCDGTACHVRKSGPIYDAIYEYLKLDGKRRDQRRRRIYAGDGGLSGCLRSGTGDDG